LSRISGLNLGKGVSPRVTPQGTRVDQPFYRRKSLLEKDFAVAMRQAKEAAEQLTRSSKLQDQT
jgi:hypothetical protein